MLFPTRFSPPSSDAAELERIDALENLGYDVRQIYSRAGTAEYNATLPLVDVVYISERVNTAEVSANLKNVCMGVVNEDMNLNDEFGIVSSNNQWGFYSDTRVYIERPPNHYILQDFPTDTNAIYELFGPGLGQDLQFLDDAPYPASYTLLAFHPNGDKSLPTLVAIDIGGLLADGTTAAGRRVVLPWMQSASGAGDFASINSDGLNIMRRSLEWAEAENDCSFLQKRSFLPDGTPLADGTQVATGTEVKFLIYINNKGETLNDVSVQDVLDPTFSYVPGTLQLDNSLGECTGNVCTAAEESAIFSSVGSVGFSSDATDGDGARYDGVNTIDAGDGNVGGNGTVNVNANSVWAVLFSVTVN